MFNLEGRVAVITGASSGLGKQMAEGFAKQGASIAILARRVDKLEDLKKDLENKYNIEVLPVKCDVTDDKSIEEAKKAVLDKFGKVDILINNAGGSKAGLIHELNNDEWDFTIDLDLTSVFKVTRSFVKPMLENNYGRIINIASMYGIHGTNQAASPYHASKAGVIGFTKAAAAEFGPFGITVNAICPGYFPTELTEETLNGDEFKGYIKMTVPVQRAGQAGELNAGALFLASDEASYVTGISLPIDGGWSNVK